MVPWLATLYALLPSGTTFVTPPHEARQAQIAEVVFLIRGGFTEQTGRFRDLQPTTAARNDEARREGHRARESSAGYTCQSYPLGADLT